MNWFLAVPYKGFATKRVREDLHKNYAVKLLRYLFLAEQILQNNFSLYH